MFGNDSDDEDPVASKQFEQFYGFIQSNRNEVGGGRGVFAACDLTSGTLIAAEVSYVPWTAECDFTDPNQCESIVRAILQDPIALEVTQTLHPRLITDVDPSEKDAILSFLQIERITHLSESSKTPVDDVIRIMLVLRHNGFGSGLYKDLCMFNHSCAPNCIKFAPKNMYSPSEIWTTTSVAAGAELTICYCNPRESTRRHLCQYLLENHQFECSCEQCKMEPVESDADAEDAILDRIVALEVELMHQRVDKDSEVKAKSKQIYREVLDCAPLVASVALQVRMYKVGASAAVASIEAYESKGRTPKVECALAFLRCSAALYGLQLGYLGADHPDLGATLHDVLEGTRGITGRFPEETATALTILRESKVGSSIVDRGICGVNAFLSWCKDETQRLKVLYSGPIRCPKMTSIFGSLGKSYWGSGPSTSIVENTDAA